MLQQIGMNLSVVDVRTGEVEVCLGLPPRIRGDSSFPDDEDDGYGYDGCGYDGCGESGWYEYATGWIEPLWTLATWPLRPLFSLFWPWSRSANRGWISDSARGRGVLPSRMRAHRALERRKTGTGVGRKVSVLEPLWEDRHPHAVDVMKTRAFDVDYEAREERKDACIPMFDQLGAASG